ncbi:MAG: alanine racemase, partial [Lentisphaeria bacterium]|nr:alanine racemase [Lentisphaeria bacterium]
MEETILRRTWAEIDLDALEHNYRTARAMVGPSIKYLGVVKADAYGHGAVQISRKLEELGADYLAVSSLDEARELRHGGIQMPILILGHTPPDMVPQLIQYNITQTVSARAKAEEYHAAAAVCGGTLKVHIKVDTGMSRLGFLVRGDHFAGGVEAIAASCALPYLEVEGIFTHFSVSDEDDEVSEQYTREQFDLFYRVLKALEERGTTFALRHCANSGAWARYPEMALDMVRPGIALYGAGADAERLGLRPVMALKSCISTIKIFDPETDIGYGRTFHTTEKTRIGVLPIGYADGLFRGLSNRMSVQTACGPAPI